MPEYGINDKDPERIAEEQTDAQFARDSAAAFKRAELQEIETQKRHADAENGNIQAAELLRQLATQIQEIRNAQEIEHQAQVKLQEDTKKQNLRQRRTELFNTVVGITSAVAAVTGAVFAVLTFFS